MKNLTKLLAVLLTAIMVLSAFVGCNNGGTAIKTSSVNTNPETSSYKADFKGEKIIISCWVDPTPKLGESEAGDAAFYALEYAKKKHNVDVEFKILPDVEYTTQFVQASLSGTKFSDIAVVHSQNHASWVNQGLLNDVTELMKDEDPKRWDLNTSLFKDKIYGVDLAPSTSYPNMFYLYNTDVLTELNLQNPQELDKKGEWNWDNFRKYAKAAIKDKNNDGVTDRYGVGSFMLPDMLRYNNGALPYVLVDGKYYNANTYSTTKKSFLNVLDFVSALCLQDKSVLGNQTGGMIPKNESIDAFKRNDLFMLMSSNTEAKDLKNNGVKNYAPVRIPKGPDTNEQNNYLAGYSFFAFPIQEDYKVKDLVAFWKDACITWDENRGNAYYESSKENELQQNFDLYFQSMADAEYMYEMGKNMKKISLYNGSLAIGGIEIFDIYQKVMKGEATSAAVIAATDGQIQSKIDEVLNKK